MMAVLMIFNYMTFNCYSPTYWFEHLLTQKTTSIMQFYNFMIMLMLIRCLGQYGDQLLEFTHK